MNLLDHVAHRVYAPPDGPWIMHQTWRNLLFAHWPVTPNVLRPLVPPELPLDVYDGSCWVAVTPFFMTGVRPRLVPPLGPLSRLNELNVRTYVTLENKPGVFFFSLDAENLSAVLGARWLYHLPYFHARMESHHGDGGLEYSSSRYGGTAEFRAHYAPIAPVELRSRGTLEHWLTERYCLYTVSKRGIHRGEIHHLQWPLQDATAEIRQNTMAAAAGIQLPQIAPLLHFSRELDVLIWPLQRVGK